MARKSDKQFYFEHLLRLDQYSGRVSRIYNKYVEEFVRLAVGLNVDPSRPFSFADYPQTSANVQKAMQKIVSEVSISINQATREEWLESAIKNDGLVDRILPTTKIPRDQIEQFYNRNLDGLEAFQKRKTSGLNLTDRIWRNTEQYKQEIELGLDLGLGEGRSAQQLSRDIRGYLKDSDKLFRRVRDKRGNLVLSKAAAAYHPGQGVYRSSYKNAMRLARTETNMAYRQSDEDRWASLPFVVGYEVKLSNNHTLNGLPFKDICDKLKGKYPKTFKFVGWHPHCRCYVTSILCTDEERERLQMMILDGEDLSGFRSSLEVKEVPEGFTEWVKDNASRAKGWKSTPYFIRDNFKEGDLSKGLIYSGGSTAAKVKPTPPPVTTPKPTPAPAPTPPAPVEAKPVDKEYISPMQPDGLKDHTQPIDQTFYDLLKKPANITNKKGGSYQQGNTVNIDLGSRFQNSTVYQSKIVYHEVGHLIHDQHYFYRSQSVRDTMDTMRSALRKKVDGRSMAGYHDAQARLDRYVSMRWNADKERLKRFTGMEKADLSEYCSSTADTLMSLHKDFGYGHTKAYFNSVSNQEAEFLAHCFEIYYGDNPVMKKVFPDMYEMMIKLVETIITEIKTGEATNRLWGAK